MRTLKELRIEKMLSIEDLAAISKVDGGLISRIETGKTKWPHFKTIKKLSEALGVNPREVAEFVDVMEGKDRPATTVKSAGQYSTEAGVTAPAPALK